MTEATAIWRATVLTLFPDMFPGPLGVSLAGKALTTGLWALEARDIRDSAIDKHRSGDDTPPRGARGRRRRYRARPPAPLDEPAGSAIDPAARDGTCRRIRPADRLPPV